MDKQEFNSLMLQRGMKPFSAGVMGVVDGYPMSLVWLNKKRITVNVATSNSSDWKLHGKELGQECKQNGLGTATTDGNGHIIFTLKTDTMSDIYNQGLRQVATMLRSRGLKAPETCAICRMGSCDAAAFVGGAAQPIHAGCIDRLAQGAAAKAQEAKVTGNYATGLIGAFLGMLVGVIVPLVAIIATDTLYAVLFALIPLASYYGYKLFRGRMNKMAAVAAIVMSILGVFIMGFLEIGYYLMTDKDFVYGIYYVNRVLTFKETVSVMPDLLSVGSNWTVILKASIMRFIFVALGIFFVWSQITRTAASEVTTVESVRATVIPLAQNPVSQDPYGDATGGSSWTGSTE